MEFLDILDFLKKNESNHSKLNIYNILNKFSNSITLLSERTDNCLPLLFIKDSYIGLVYSDENFNNFEYIFTNHEEISMILQKHLSMGETLYFHFSGDIYESHEEIMEKINVALMNNDIDTFNHYSKILNDRRK